MVILDTDVIIDHLRLKGKKASHLEKIAKEKQKEILALSVVSVQELYEGKSTRNDEEENYLLLTITPLKILPYTYEVAQVAGKLERDLARPIEFADAAIAATAIMNECRLVTLNKKDFQGIKELEIV